VRLVAFVLLMAAAVEFVGAAEFDRVFTAEERCNIDDATVCAESLGWLDRD
jgi:hypothetical protein